MEVFIVPYLLWFGYVALAITFFFFRNVQDYYKLCIFLFVGMTVFLVVSTVYPNGHYLRPRVFERDNIFVTMVKGLYMVDTPTNLFPSIHVYASIGVHIALARSTYGRKYPMFRWASGLLMISIILSTMFLKQHSVLDVMAAIILSSGMYSLIYRTEFGKEGHRVFRRRRKTVKA